MKLKSFLFQIHCIFHVFNKFKKRDCKSTDIFCYFLLTSQNYIDHVTANRRYNNYILISKLKKIYPLHNNTQGTLRRYSFFICHILRCFCSKIIIKLFGDLFHHLIGSLLIELKTVSSKPAHYSRH